MNGPVICRKFTYGKNFQFRSAWADFSYWLLMLDTHAQHVVMKSAKVYFDIFLYRSDKFISGRKGIYISNSNLLTKLPQNTAF